jgi:redox-sensitive bicupin YhaK (pirin superfamily)
MAVTDSLRIIRAPRRESRDLGWLKTHWLLSFEDYFDPENMEFGVLRVFNDDRVAPGKGFPAHRHSEMEIVTLVLEGRLTHRDSAGNEAFLSAGDVQAMSAGTGVFHSEMNLGKAPLHFYQIWFIPDRGGLKPSYRSGSFPDERWVNTLLPLASGKGAMGAMSMSSPATVYGCILEKERSVRSIGGLRRAFIYVTSGEVTVQGDRLTEGDQFRVLHDGIMEISSEAGSRFVLIDMPEER